MKDLILSNEELLQGRLELPRAILIQLRDTHLFNPLIVQAIADIDYLLAQRPIK